MNTLSLPLKHLLLVVGLIVLLGVICLDIRNDLAVFQSKPTNGAFQLYNPLHRLAAGQISGRDFDFFHGLGTLLIHYPIFAAWGADLKASEISRLLVSPLAFLACFYVCARAWRIPPLVALSTCGFVLVFGTLVLRGSGATPGNSMVGLRSAMPALVLPFALLFARFQPVFAKPIGFHALVASGLGVSMYIATEQGLAAIACHLLLLFILPVVPTGWKMRLMLLPVTTVCSIATYVGLVALTSRSYFRDSLVFALKDLPKDQFWYFGAPPNEIPAFPDALWNPLIVIGVWSPSIFLIFELLWIRVQQKRKLPQPWADTTCVLVLILMSLIVQLPQLAAFSHYQIVSTRNIGLVLMIWVVRGWPLLRSGQQHLIERAGATKVPLPLVFGLLILMLGLVAAVLIKTSGRARSSGEQLLHYSGLQLSRHWASDLITSQAIGMEGMKVAGTFRTLVEDQCDSQFKGPDYIIHALGSRRSTFLVNLKDYDPDIFLTLNPAGSGYEEWVQLRHWDVYRYLIGLYHPVQASATHVFWKKGDGVLSPTQSSGELVAHPQGQIWLTPPNSGKPQVFTTRVRYSIVNPLGKIPVAGKLPRFLLTREVVSAESRTSHIAASLPSAEMEWEFPMILQPGERAEFSLDLKLAWPGVSARIESIQLEPLSADPAVIAALSGIGEHLQLEK
jgi:hypothetical protein